MKSFTALALVAASVLLTGPAFAKDAASTTVAKSKAAVVSTKTEKKACRKHCAHKAAAVKPAK